MWGSLVGLLFLNPLLGFRRGWRAWGGCWRRTVAAHLVLPPAACRVTTMAPAQVVIEDYMHSGASYAALVAVRLGCFALAAAGIVAPLRIAFNNG